MKLQEVDSSNSHIDDDCSPSPSGTDLGIKQRNRYDYFAAGTAQGSQGSQMKIESNNEGNSAGKYSKNSESPLSNELGFPAPLGSEPNEFDPNTSQTNALLNIRDEKFNLILQQVYYSEKCSWFYIGLLVLSFGLVLVTIFDGFQVAESTIFIVLEFILNLLIGIDFACRIKLVGCQKYVRDPANGKIRWWNIFDALVVTVCNGTFAVSLFSKTGAVKGFEEATEEGLIVMWCIWQTLRMILIAKKQRLARQSAKTLINFENIVVDTDFGGALSFRASDVGDRAHMSGDPDDIVVEMANFEKGIADDEVGGTKARLRSKINPKSSVTSGSSNRFGRQASGGASNMQHYVIDDDEDDEEDSQQDSHRAANQPDDNNQDQNTSNNSSGNVTPREIIFDIEDE